MNRLRIATMALLLTTMVLQAADPAKPAPPPIKKPFPPEGPSKEAIAKATEAKMRLEEARKKHAETAKRLEEARAKLMQAKDALSKLPPASPPNNQLRGEAEKLLLEVRTKYDDHQRRHRRRSERRTEMLKLFELQKNSLEQMKKQNAPPEAVDRASKELETAGAELKKPDDEAEQIAKVLPALEKEVREAEAALKKASEVVAKPDDSSPTFADLAGENHFP